jgi:hypothetical protein
MRRKEADGVCADHNDVSFDLVSHLFAKAKSYLVPTIVSDKSMFLPPTNCRMLSRSSFGAGWRWVQICLYPRPFLGGKYSALLEVEAVGTPKGEYPYLPPPH